MAPAATAVPGPVTRHGRAVVFTSTADDLVPDDTNGVADAFVSKVVPPGVVLVGVLGARLAS